jgi:hypothetical protein
MSDYAIVRKAMQLGSCLSCGSSFMEKVHLFYANESPFDNYLTINQPMMGKMW